MVSRRPTPYGAYLQIAGTLRERVASGEYSQVSRLPSEAALCEEFAVTRGTVRRALAVLRDEGLITVTAGVGRFVRVPGQGTPGVVGGPQYQRIAAQLRAQIDGGAFRAGEVLPGELRISECYGVSRQTAQRALVELERAGLVVCVRGRGRIVRSKTSPDDPGASVDVR
ncbi:GntR family transcriptional regulator [Actinomadura sp. SCN-SB]|uniref:GntR family transcriptional regulator n=1 Tax=Actinomadura sp. SCN-SB TaxID=3373092 RepID=UPI0037517FF2